MKAGVSLYSFHDYKNDDSLGIKGCIEKAKELGFTGFDFVDFGNYSERSEYLARATDIGNFCREIGMEPVCFCTGANFVTENRKSEIERMKFSLEIAAALGCSVMRHDGANTPPSSMRIGRSFDALLPMLAQCYREITDHAETLGIKTCVENHGFFIQHPERVEKLINAVDSENFGALIDIGNFMCVGAEPTDAVALLAPYAIHCHAKDFHFRSGSLDDPGEGFFRTSSGDYLRGAMLGHGVVKVRQCIEILKRSGYDGYLSLEFEGMEDPIKGIELGGKNLRRAIGI
ncbi:MAG: sugar phosphate isomerase/epimerase [Clostridia bacterium]|nr:sugar phosphate isomerase/epimerase [Clostridia bacterium]